MVGADPGLRSGLVLVQVALSFVLLVGAALLLQSLQKMRNTSPGFSTHDVLVTNVDLFGSGYDAQRAENFQKQLIARLQIARRASSPRHLPASFPWASFRPASASIAVDGYVPPPNEQPVVDYNQVSPGYLRHRGNLRLSPDASSHLPTTRPPRPSPSSMSPWSGSFGMAENPIGQRLQVAGRWMRVVGVAKVSKYEYISESPKPFFFVPAAPKSFRPRAA